MHKISTQLLAVMAYFALVVFLYWRQLWDAAAVSVILGLLFLFKSVVDSGALSLAHLSPADPKFDVGPASRELLKTLSFFAVGLGAWIDLAKALQEGLIPGTVPTVVIHITLVCTFAICVVSCCARFAAALKSRPRH